MHTHVTFVLDSSGSMEKIRDDTTGGFNAFLDDQQDEEGTATVSLYSFDTTVERVYNGYPIEDAPKLTDENYTPSGRTALHDAIVTAIDGTESLLIDDEIEDTDNVIVVVLTDGKENASETPGDTVRERVEEKQDEDDWEFLFIGANQDAALTAEGIGMNADHSLDMDHSGEGTRTAYQATSQSVSRARRSGSTGGYQPDDTDQS